MDVDPFDDEPPAKSGVDFKRGLCVGALIGCVGLAIVSGVGALIVMGVMSETGTIPGTKVVTGAELNADARQMLIDEGVVEAGELIHHYYSTGILSYREDGNLYTDRRVISYWEMDDEISVSEAFYSDIERIEPDYQDGLLLDSVVWIHGQSDGEEWAFDLYVSNEDGLDHTFIEGLIETWEQER